jgi:chemotaxis protein methyltransferase CheR
MDFFRIVNYIRINYGVNLINKRTLIEKRLESIILDNNFSDFNEFMNAVESDDNDKLNTILIGALVTNHTFFMREELHFEMLKKIVLPKLLKGNQEKDSIRIWSAATSSGQEAYTIEMILKDFLEIEQITCNIEILGTDISDTMLEIAENGEYSKEQMDFVCDEWKRKYFTKKINGDYKINDSMKKDVVFEKLNLMSKFEFSNKFHIIFLRNTLIYFESGIITEVVDKVANNLMIGGYLFIGVTETIEISSTKLVNVQPSVYRRI